MITQSARARAAQRAHVRCAVPGCGKFVHGLSAYCSRHHQNDLRHGDPESRALRLYELRPYTKQAKAFLKANASQPAIVESYQVLDEWLRTGAETGFHLADKKNLTWNGRMAAECARLHSAGITGRDIFETLLAIWLMSGADERRLTRHSRPFRFAVARLVFNLAPRSGKRKFVGDTNRIRKYTARLSSELLDNFGRGIVVWCLPVLLKIEDALSLNGRRDVERKQRLVTAANSSSFAVA